MTIQVYSQESNDAISTLEGSKSIFEYRGEIYEFPNMGEILSQDYDAFEMYTSAMKKKENAKYLGYTALGFVGAGVILIALEDGDNENYILTEAVYGLLSIIVIAPVLATASLINRIKYNNKRRKTIALFNNTKEISYIDKSNDWDLKLGTGQYGYGLVLNF